MNIEQYKSLGKVSAILLGMLLVIILFAKLDNSDNKETYKYEPQTVINDSKTYNQSWRMPIGSEYAEIGKLIVQNNIKICGEYHVKEVTTGEYVIACSPDGINWQYFVAYTKIEKFYRASDEMIAKLTPPR